MKNFFSKVCWLFLLLSPFCGSAEEFISSNSIQKFADIVINPASTKFDPNTVKDGDIVYVEGCVFAFFFKNIRPLIHKKYVLITHSNDASMPGIYKKILNDPNLIVWFSQNVNYSHPKLKFLPIGIDRIGEFKEKYLKTLINLKNNPLLKEHLLFMNFKIWTNPEERGYVFNLFKDEAFCFTKKYDRNEVGVFLNDLAASKFVLSPMGGGMDCYRTWEALYLGTIPIVRSCFLDPLYEDLPILIVRDWEEITEDFLFKKYDEMSKKKYNFEKLAIKYWYDQIDSYRSSYRNSFDAP